MNKVRKRPRGVMIGRTQNMSASDYGLLACWLRSFDNELYDHRFIESAVAIESLQKQLAEASASLEEALAELDEASPLMQCARCGTPTRMHKLVSEEWDEVAEEWDEWECYPCNDRENKRELELPALRRVVD
jgi:hypothetical protein